MHEQRDLMRSRRAVEEQVPHDAAPDFFEDGHHRHVDYSMRTLMIFLLLCKSSDSLEQMMGESRFLPCEHDATTAQFFFVET